MSTAVVTGGAGFLGSHIEWMTGGERAVHASPL
jgi:thioester reductase-like protein